MTRTAPGAGARGRSLPHSLVRVLCAQRRYRDLTWLPDGKQDYLTRKPG